MYERFTDRARKVMQLANQEAQRFNHEYIGTEHILLGLVKETNIAQGKKPATRADLRYGEGPDGRIFILNKWDGVIRELVP